MDTIYKTEFRLDRILLVSALLFAAAMASSLIA